MGNRKKSMYAHSTGENPKHQGSYKKEATGGVKDGVGAPNLGDESRLSNPIAINENPMGNSNDSRRNLVSDVGSKIESKRKQKAKETLLGANAGKSRMNASIRSASERSEEDFRAGEREKKIREKGPQAGATTHFVSPSEESHRAADGDGAQDGLESRMNSATRLSEGAAEITVNQGFASADTRSRNLQLLMNILAASRLYLGAILQNWLFNAKTRKVKNSWVTTARKALLQIQHKLHPLTIQTWERLKLKLKQLFENLEPILITAWSIGCNQGIPAAKMIQKLILVLLEWWARGLLSVFRLSLAALFFSLWCAALNLCILAGFLKFGIALGLSMTLAFSVEYSIGIALFCLYGASILWIFGSFWTTLTVILIAGSFFLSERIKVAILIVMVYAAHSVIIYGGGPGFMLCAGLGFITSDLAVHFLAKIDWDGDDKQTQFNGETYHNSSSEFAQEAATDSKGVPSDAFRKNDYQQVHRKAFSHGVSDNNSKSPEVEVSRLRACKDHYAAFGLARYSDIDATCLKQEYKKKAMLVHPDKNRGNAQAEEAFKRLQNAYEVLVDDGKRISYDDDLKREELAVMIRQHFAKHQNGRCRNSSCYCHHSENASTSGIPMTAREIHCQTCNGIHIIVLTDRNKQQARWCQECQKHHRANDGDGWVEQLGHSTGLRIFQKVETRAYACSEGKVFDVTDWVSCQGLKCAPNTHKPSFSMGKADVTKNSTSPGGKVPNAGMFNGKDFEHMTREEFSEWLKNARASGLFSKENDVQGDPGEKPASKPKQQNPKKKKGKSQS